MSETENCENSNGFDDQDGQNVEIALSSWDPMEDMYSRKAFNTYNEHRFDSDFGATFSTLNGRDISPGKGDGDVVKLYVGNIPLNLTKEGLKRQFSKAGEVISAQVCQSKDTGRGVTFGFVTYKSVRAAAEAIRLFDDFEFGPNHKLRVRKAYTESERNYRKAKAREEDQYLYDLYAGLDTEMTGEESKKPLADQEKSEGESPLKLKEEEEEIANDNNEDVINGSPCSFCGKLTRKRCQQCKTWYCSKPCQKKDWARHKQMCTKGGREDGSTADESRWTVSIDGLEEEYTDELPSVNVDTKDEVNHKDTRRDEGNANACKSLKLLKKCDLPKPSVLPNEFALIFGEVIDERTISGHPVLEEGSLELAKLSEEIIEYLGENTLDTCCTYEEDGLVLANFMGEWGRAELKHFDEKTQEVGIVYIDYGNSQSVKLDSLKILPTFAAKLPPMARKFILAEVPLLDNKECLQFIKDTVAEKCRDKILQVAVIGKEDNALHEIIVNVEDEEETLNRIVVSVVYSCSKEQAGGGYSTTCVEGGKADNMAVVRPTCDTAYKATFMKDLPIQTLPLQDTFVITLTNVVSPYCLYGWIVGDDNVEAMAALIDDLNTSYSGEDEKSFVPKLGEVCVSLFPDDGTWYRANALAFNNDGTIRVKYIDFGNEADVEATMLRRIQERLLKLPCQAIHFSLDALNIADTKLEVACAYIREATVEKPCTVHVLRRDPDCVVIDMISPDHERSMRDVLHDAYKSDKLEGNQERNTSSRPHTDKNTGVDKKQNEADLGQAKNENKLPTYQDLPKAKALPIQFNVIVGNVVDERTIIGHAVLEEESLKLSEMIKDLEQYYSSNERNEGICLFEEGGLVCIKYMDEWSRAELISYDPSTNQVELLYFDFGNSEFRCLDEVKRLPVFALKLAPMAQKLRLAKIPSVEDVALKDRACCFLKEKLTDQLPEAKVCRSVDKEVVEIELTVEEGEDSVNDLLLRILKEGGKKETKSVSKPIEEEIAKRTMVNDIPLVGVPLENTFTVTITEVVSPSCMYGWIIGEDTLECMAGLIDALNSNYSLEDGEAYRPIVGEMVVALFPEDESWYRATILEMNKDGTMHVMYVDFGNVADVEISMIRRIKKELLNVPRQAVKIALVDAEVPDVSREDAINFIREETRDKECKVVVARRGGDCLYVQVYVPDSTVTLNETILVKFGPRAADSKYNNVAKKEHEEPLVNDAGSNDCGSARTSKDHIVTKKYKPALLPMTENLQITVTHVLNPWKFFGFIDDDEVSLKVEQLNQLMKDNVSSDAKEVDDLCYGMPVCALSSGGTWYRASVLKVNDDSAKVAYVDYGSTEDLPFGNIRLPIDDVMGLPCRALCFSLSDVKPFNEHWEVNVTKRLEQLILKRSLKAVVNGVKNLAVRVKLYQAAEHFSVNEVLVKENLAITPKRSNAQNHAHSNFEVSQSRRSNDSRNPPEHKQQWSNDAQRFGGKGTQGHRVGYNEFKGGSKTSKHDEMYQGHQGKEINGKFNNRSSDRGFKFHDDISRECGYTDNSRTGRGSFYQRSDHSAFKRFTSPSRSSESSGDERRRGASHDINYQGSTRSVSKSQSGFPFVSGYGDKKDTGSHSGAFNGTGSYGGGRNVDTRYQSDDRKQRSTYDMKTSGMRPSHIGERGGRHTNARGRGERGRNQDNRFPSHAENTHGSPGEGGRHYSSGYNQYV